MSNLDFSTAEPATFEVIPDGTEVPVLLKVQAGDYSQGDGCLKLASTGSLMLNLEATITGGKYAKRKVFFGFYMGREDGELTEGQQTAVDMSRSKLRAIVEAARGYAPTDETAAATAARKLKSLRDFDNMEVTVILGIEKGTGGYADKNVLKRVVPHGKAKGPDGPDEAASMRQAKPTTPKKGW